MLDADQARTIAERMLKKLYDRVPEQTELDQYANGEQPLTFASAEWAEFHKNRYAGFSDNWCGPVSSAPNERLGITGVTLPKPAGLKTALGALWDDWNRNNGDAQSSQGFLESIIAKRSYTIVWGTRDDEPEFTWEHPNQVIVEYDASNPNIVVHGLKAWSDETHEYATLYTADDLWKWRRSLGPVRIVNGRTAGGLHISSTAGADLGGGDWQPYQPPTDDTWPLPNPLGEVPVVEWPNRPRLGNEPLSDIAGTKAMQNAVNLLWAYLFGAADHASMPGRVIMGQEPPKIPILNEQGQKIGEKVVDIKELQQGRFLWLTGQNTTISEFTTAKLDVFTNVIEIAVAHIAAQTRTPSHYLINADNVPAAGYELAEAGLVKKVEEFQTFSNAPARRHLRLMAKVRGEEKLADALRLATPTWQNAAIRSESQLADALLKKKQTGYPLEYILELDGNSPTEIARIMGMVRAEAQDATLVSIAQELSRGAADAAPVGD